MSGVISVTMLEVLKPQLNKWLDEKGLALALMGTNDAGTDEYVVVIPKGSRLEQHLGRVDD